MATERQDFARKLRRQSTTPEDILWNLLRAHRLDGLKFRRQVPLLGYTVDFLCLQRKFVIELDGAQHDAERDYDAARTQEIERHGFTLIRFPNETVLNDRDAVIARIREAAGTATENPLLTGEGFPARVAAPKVGQGRAVSGDAAGVAGEEDTLCQSRYVA